MVWVYDSPLTASEQKVYKVLKRKLKEEDVAKTTVKILSLYAFLKKSNFSSAKQLQEAAFLDKAKTKPVFTDEQAKSVLKSLKKKGGASERYPLTDHLARKTLDFVTTLVPEGVKGTAESAYQLVTSPVRIVKENVPFSDLLIGAMHGATETGVTVAGDVAEGVGGPIGAAMVAPLTAMAAGMASLVSLGEQDLGQAVAHVANAVPVIGSALGKGITQMEHQVQNLKKHPELAEYTPISEFITGRPMKSLSLESLQETAKERATAELQKRGLPTSVEDLQAKAQARGMAELQKRGLPTSTEDLQAQAKARGMAELQKRGLPTSTEDLQAKAQARVTSELQKRLPDVAMTAPAAGGKRFSTQRRKHSKWPKTRRSKSAKV